VRAPVLESSLEPDPSRRAKPVAGIKKKAALSKIHREAGIKKKAALSKIHREAGIKTKNAARPCRGLLRLKSIHWIDVSLRDRLRRARSIAQRSEARAKPQNPA